MYMDIVVLDRNIGEPENMVDAVELLRAAGHNVDYKGEAGYDPLRDRYDMVIIHPKGGDPSHLLSNIERYALENPPKVLCCSNWGATTTNDDSVLEPGKLFGKDNRGKDKL